MKIIEAVITRTSLDDFSRCARRLGIFGFDLSDEHALLHDRQRLAMPGERLFIAEDRLKVDFAVPDEETKPTVHAVLESVHPDSIAIFKFDQDVGDGAATPRADTRP